MKLFCDSAIQLLKLGYHLLMFYYLTGKPENVRVLTINWRTVKEKYCQGNIVRETIMNLIFGTPSVFSRTAVAYWFR